jgi:hypothetical protein
MYCSDKLCTALMTSSSFDGSISRIDEALHAHHLAHHRHRPLKHAGKSRASDSIIATL